MVGAAPQQGFDAFISYSHAVDGKLAPAVRLGLERLARPWLRRRALRVFHDTTGLGATPGLWSTISRALDNTRYFILLASPESAASHWVHQEVDHFLSSHSSGQLLIVLTGGECRWDVVAGDFDWAVTTALPPRLAGVFAEEPLYVDLRWARTEVLLDLHHARFRQALADLAAPIHDLARDELDAVDLREFRRARGFRRSAVAAVTILAVLTSGASVIAVRSAAEARSQSNLSEAGRLAALSTGYADHQTDLAILLARHSLAIAPTRDGARALARAMTQPGGGFGLVPGTDTPGASSTSVSPSGLDIDAAGTTLVHPVDRTPVVWPVGFSGRQRRLSPLPNFIERLDLSPDGLRLLAVSDDRGWLIELGSGAMAPVGNEVAEAKFVDNHRFLTLTANGVVAAWRLGTGVPVGLWSRQTGDGSGREVRRQLTVSPDGRHAALASVGGPLLQLATADGAVEWRKTDLDDWYQVLTYDAASTLLAYGTLGGLVQSVDVQRGRVQHGFQAGRGMIRSLAFVPDGRTLAVGGSDARIGLYALESDLLIGDLPGHGSDVTGLIATPDGRHLYSASLDGVRRWDLTTGQPAASLLGSDEPTNETRGLTISDDGELIAAGRGRVSLWRRAVARHPFMTVEGEDAVFISGTLLLAVASGTNADLYDGRTGAFVRSFPVMLSPGYDLVGAARRLTTVGGRESRVFDPVTGEELVRTEHPWFVSSAASSADGSVLALAVWVDSVRVRVVDAAGAVLSDWSPADPASRGVTYRYVVAVSPDGAEVAVGKETGRVLRLAARTGEVLGEFTAHTRAITDLAYSPDGTLIATAARTFTTRATGSDGGLRVWDVATGTLIANRVAHHDDPREVEFSADGRWLVSSGDDGQVLIWPSTVEWLARSCAVAARDLDSAEREKFLRPSDRDRSVC